MRDAYLTVLKRTHKIVSRGWCQGHLARNKKGQVVHPASVSATCWCLSGALYAATCAEKEGDVLYATIEEFLRWGYFKGKNIEAFNDAPTTTQAEILRYLDEVISARENSRISLTV